MSLMLPGGGSVSGFRPNEGSNQFVEDTMKASNPNYNDILANLTLSNTTANNSKDGEFYKYLSTLETMASKGDVSALEKLFNYYATEKSEQTARDWTAMREDNQYQRLVEDLRKAGISPYVMSSAVPGISSSNGHGYSGTSLVSASNNRATNARALQNSLTSFASSALMALAIALKVII